MVRTGISITFINTRGFQKASSGCMEWLSCILLNKKSPMQCYQCHMH
uniref:Uncharacterized protein n=1 Tax=Anguilla anguilla TaxID=7936 RepID=A0A0E9PDM6_ANGAN